MLCRHQTGADPGAHRVRQRDLQQPGRHGKRQGTALSPSLSPEGQPGKQQRAQIGKAAAPDQQRAGPHRVVAGKAQQRRRRQKGVDGKGAHLDPRDPARLPQGGEASIQTGGERQAGQACGKDPQTFRQLRPVQPEGGHRICAAPQQHPCPRPQQQGIGQAELYHAAAGAAAGGFVFHQQADGGQPHAGNGQRRRQPIGGHQQLIQADARRADLFAQPRLEAHG